MWELPSQGTARSLCVCPVSSLCSLRHPLWVWIGVSPSTRPWNDTANDCSLLLASAEPFFCSSTQAQHSTTQESFWKASLVLSPSSASLRGSCLRLPPLSGLQALGMEHCSLPWRSLTTASACSSPPLPECPAHGPGGLPPALLACPESVAESSLSRCPVLTQHLASGPSLGTAPGRWVS